MKKIWSVPFLLLFLYGCQTENARLQPTNTSSTATTVSIKKDCAFNSINHKPYRLADSFREYVSNSFFYDPEKEMVYQRDPERFKSLTSQKFKVRETGVITAEDINLRKPKLAEYRYSDEVFDQIPHKRDKAYSTKVVMEDCTEYYLSGSTDAKSIKEEIVNIDGSKINDKDVLHLVGEKALPPINLIQYDRFEKKLEVKTPFHEKMLIRGAVDTKKNSISYIQLYVELPFLKKWGEISYAVDTDAQRHKVTQITRDSDCSSFSDTLGCLLTETVGITLSYDFLKKHQDGFELKVAGKQDRLVTVPGSMIKIFLTALDKAIKQSKSGELKIEAF